MLCLAFGFCIVTLVAGGVLIPAPDFLVLRFSFSRASRSNRMKADMVAQAVAFINCTNSVHTIIIHIY